MISKSYTLALIALVVGAACGGAGERDAGARVAPDSTRSACVAYLREHNDSMCDVSRPLREDQCDDESDDECYRPNFWRCMSEVYDCVELDAGGLYRQKGDDVCDRSCESTDGGL